jgi:hypothetical protein
MGAFAVSGLSSVTIGNGLSNIEDNAFANCDNLASVYFTGNAPTADSSVFYFDGGATVYYLLGTTGWSNTFCSCRVVLTPPFTVQPQSQIANAGSTVTFVALQIAA